MHGQEDNFSNLSTHAAPHRNLNQTMGFTITSAMNWWRRECPEQIAVHLDDGTLTYEQLWAWATRIGQHFSSLGIKPQDRVAVIALSSLEYVATAYALLQIGAIAAPMSVRCTSRELQQEMETFEPTLVIADAERMDTASGALTGVQARKLRPLAEMSDLRGAPLRLTYEPKADDIAFIIGTSGSTAKPKRVIFTHRTVMTYALEFLVMQPRCGHGAKVLSMGPFSSTSGYLSMLQFMSLGIETFIESKFDPERALRIMVTEKITIMQHAPIYFERIAALPEFADADLSHLYFAQTAGARIPVSLLSAWRDKGVVLRQAYGSAESGGAWAARDDTALSAPEKCGRGGMFTEFAILDKDGSLAPPGTPGEIVVRGPCMTPGYWRDPRATEAAIRDGWLSNGDLGVIDEGGALRFIDRIKDIIISGGLNISALEVENVIERVPGVKEVAVISASDDKFGETPLAVIYGDKSQLSVEAIIAHCNQNLSNYKVPRYVAIEDEPLPRLPIGKISKVDLRAKYKDASKFLPKVR